MKRTFLMFTAAATVCSGTAFAAEKPAVGAELLEKRCSVCHQSSRPKSAKKSAEQWESTVTRMMGKGAKLTADEKRTLVEYLAKTYRP